MAPTWVVLGRDFGDRQRKHTRAEELQMLERIRRRLRENAYDPDAWKQPPS